MTMQGSSSGNKPNRMQKLKKNHVFFPTFRTLEKIVCLIYLSTRKELTTLHKITQANHNHIYSYFYTERFGNEKLVWDFWCVYQIMQECMRKGLWSKSLECSYHFSKYIMKLWIMQTVKISYSQESSEKQILFLKFANVRILKLRQKEIWKNYNST